MEKKLEELGIKDCFKDAKEVLEVSSKDIEKLRLKISEKVCKNEKEHIKGIDLLLSQCKN